MEIVISEGIDLQAYAFSLVNLSSHAGLVILDANKIDHAAGAESSIHLLL